MVFLVLAVLVVLTTATTMWLLHMRAPRENDPDSIFWYAFAGLCVLAPLILIPVQHNKLSSLALLGISAVTAAASHTLLRRYRAASKASMARQHARAAHATVTAQHDYLIERWCRYELDPALAIDFPAMTDVRIPETARLIRSVTAAARLRTALPDTFDAVDSYQQAVAGLRLALETAEENARAGTRAA
ncbi:hypothetical protein MB46_04840 [Arthrobacter alpinus]|uniref:hypothetical protein n=1 Tax=Arthrobacter alpinus TaxID=656366 RepID=UPI000678FAB2|nr:hypothetical protein [Arthrobacter alpinus]ALV44935.1 hypothetical protein MB46_04840 [Arthrobacter alpinus]